MRFRSVLLAAPLLLSGCGTLSGFSWSSLSPFNWFGDAIQVSDSGVGGINAGTPLSEAVINDALNGDYRLRGGMGMDHDRVTAFYQALDGDQIKLVVSGNPKSSVQKVEVLDDAIASAWGVKLGDTFAQHYSKAFEACQPGQGDDAGSVECVAPQSRHVSYLFSGDWSGPEGLIPPDDILRAWRVSKIVWHAQARP